MSKTDDYIAQIVDWRGERLAELRSVINQAAPELTEDFKWSVPVWVGDNGLVCAISAFKDHVKINFFKGSRLDDPTGIFNSGLDSKDHRSINLAQTDQINQKAIADLVVQATALGS